jgi:hypothetical protein
MASVVYLQVLNSGRVRLFFGRGLLWPDFGVLVARQVAAFLLLAVGRADLHELGFAATVLAT